MMSKERKAVSDFMRENCEKCIWYNAPANNMCRAGTYILTSYFSEGELDQWILDFIGNGLEGVCQHFDPEK